MELKVWVEGIQRIVCGVTETTTCQEVVFALAHATGKSGRFTLIERWRNNERQLSPNENPMKIIMKWGEYSNDVQFILQRSDTCKSGHPSNQSKPKSCNSAKPCINNSVELSQKNKDNIKPLTFNTNHISGSDNIGIVKGVPQMKPISLEVKESLSHSPRHSPKKSSYSGSDKSESPSQRVAPPYKDPPAPPPYRDPPPPNSSIYQDKYKKNLIQESTKSQNEKDENRTQFHENVLYNAQYRELIALINYQREKLSSQQADITKYDAEIVFLEGKEREKKRQLDFLTQEIISVTNLSKSNQEQIQALAFVENESEVIKQQEKTLQTEISLIRSKLANCETELLQCKNKIRLLMDELHLEQRAENRRNESRKQLEHTLLIEIERFQKDIDLAKQSTDLHHLTADTLKREVASLETAIIEKKKQVEHLVTEMKEANLQSLSIAPPDDLRQIVEGPVKSGSVRKMIGSPRQLENAVPTNKNPHGVWV